MRFYQDVLRIWFGWVRLPAFFRRKHASGHVGPTLVTHSEESSLGDKKNFESLEDLPSAVPSEFRSTVGSTGEASIEAVRGHVTSAIS
jgi:hypothetical protein